MVCCVIEIWVCMSNVIVCVYYKEDGVFFDGVVIEDFGFDFGF